MLTHTPSAEPSGTGAADGAGCADRRGRQEASLGPGLGARASPGGLFGAGGFHGRSGQPGVPDAPGVRR